MSTNIKGKPDQPQLEQYRQMPLKIRAEVAYEYLYHGLNMEQVGDKLGLDDIRQVSLITRCNGFYVEGGKSQESGRYGKKGGSSKKPLRKPSGKGALNLTLQDFEEFIQKYPGGELDYRVMDKFMLEKDAARSKTARGNKYSEADTDIRPNPEFSPERMVWNDERNDLKEETTTDEEMVVTMIGIAIIVILIVIFRKKIYSFLMSLLPLIVIIAMIYVAFRLAIGASNKSKQSDNAPVFRQWDESDTKQKQGRKIENIVSGGFLCFLGGAGLMSGAVDNMGSLIIAIILIVIGISQIMK